MTELTLTAFSLPTDLQPVDSPRHKGLLSAHATIRRLDECLTVSEEAGISDSRSHCSSIHFSASLAQSFFPVMAFDQHQCRQQRVHTTHC